MGVTEGLGVGRVTPETRPSNFPSGIVPPVGTAAVWGAAEPNGILLAK